MALPQIQLPKYKIQMLTQNKEIYIRPFTVKEEKILLMATEGNQTDMAIALLQIIENCVIGDIDVESLDFFEVMYLFMNIKKISTSEEIEVMIRDDEDENIKYEAVCNLNEDMIIRRLDEYLNSDKNKTNVIQLEGNDIYIKIKPISFKDYLKLMKMSDSIKDDEKGKDVKLLYTALILTIKEIYDNENVYNPEEYTLEELSKFYDDITFKDKDKIKEIYENLPTIGLKFHYIDKNGESREKVIDDIKTDFLAS